MANHNHEIVRMCVFTDFFSGIPLLHPVIWPIGLYHDDAWLPLHLYLFISFWVNHPSPSFNSPDARAGDRYVHDISSSPYITPTLSFSLLDQVR